jgi:phosphoribosyl 1,2-cyclic phosphodiesterase
MSNYLKFWGVRGSYPTTYPANLETGGNTACIELAIEDQTIILDAGTGIIPLGNHLISIGGPRKLVILLSHYHWDHIQGLPFFVPAYVPDWELDFFGPGGNPKSIKEGIRSQMSPPHFPAEIEGWHSKINTLELNDGQLTYGNVAIIPFSVHHPGQTFGYKIAWQGRTILYVPDNELEYLYNTIDQKRKKGELDPESYEMMIELANEDNNSTITHFKNADILIHDSQYFPEEYPMKRGWGHSTYEVAVRNAIKACVKNLFLFHHDPNHSDDQLKGMMQSVDSLIKIQRSSIHCHLAVEGMTIIL